MATVQMQYVDDDQLHFERFPTVEDANAKLMEIVGRRAFFTGDIRAAFVVDDGGAVRNYAIFNPPTR